MKITYKGDYALKTILDLSLHYGNGPVSIHELASRADIPAKFLEQILLDLKRGGFVESRRGKIGGYLLARHPRQITVGEIIRFIEGPIEPVACVSKDYQGCNDVASCVFRRIWKDVAAQISGIIDKINFEDLAKRVGKKSRHLVYQI